MKMFGIANFSFIILSLIGFGYAERAWDKMYSSVSGASCFRRLNATHSTGCTSKHRGSDGALHYVKNEDDITFLINNPPAPPYAVLLPPRLFNRENVFKLKDSSYVSVIVLINDTVSLANFSQESKCPNQLMGYSRTPTCDPSKPETTWNPFGNGLLHENFDLPILFISDKNETDKLIHCFEKFNENKSEPAAGPLCSIQVKSFMSAASNSEICMRRSRTSNSISQTRYCDPLQGKNVYGTLFPREIVDANNRSTKSTEKFIMISARMDTTSMFDGVGIGAKDSLVAFATLISTAHFIRKVFDSEPTDTKVNLLFTLFNGESYDYIGSQRFVYDLNNKAFPSKATFTNTIEMDSIDLLIDLGTIDDPGSLVIYNLKEFEMARNFSENIKKYNEEFGFNIDSQTESNANLPPTSAQSFLSYNTTFPAIIITSKPGNKFYHSIFDDIENIKFKYRNSTKDFDLLNMHADPELEFPVNSIQMKIRNVSTLIGLSLYEMLTQKSHKKYIASVRLVDEFLYCYLVASNCKLVRASVSLDTYPFSNFPPQRYISVQPYSLVMEGTAWANKILGYVLSTKVINRNKGNCSLLPLYWVAGSNYSGECRLTTHNYSLALSPAFEDEDYNFKSNKYSTWTESTWNELSSRMYLRPSPTHESFTFAIGFVVLIISFVMVFFINSKSDVLFGDITAAEHVTLPAQC